MEEWEKKAREAEARLGEAEEELARARLKLEETTGALAASERRRDLERAMAQAGAIDLDAAVLLAERSGEASAEHAAAALRRERPHLFRPERRSGSGAPAGERDEAPDALDALAARARTTGDPRVLAEYLRRRRER